MPALGNVGPAVSDGVRDLETCEGSRNRRMFSMDKYMQTHLKTSTTNSKFNDTHIIHPKIMRKFKSESFKGSKKISENFACVTNLPV
jgi:hypothetical protein